MAISRRCVPSLAGKSRYNACSRSCESRSTRDVQADSLMRGRSTHDRPRPSRDERLYAWCDSNRGEIVMDVNTLIQNAAATLMAAAWKVAGAFVLWLVGRWVIAFASRTLGNALARQQIDVTLPRYLQPGLTVILNVALLVAILGFFGVETTTFAALLAAGGVAIGVAWGGVLANFAAGAFLVVLRPFKVGDVVTAGGVTGTVDSVGLFATVINTPDNVSTIVGNNKIFSDVIQNFSENPYRRGGRADRIKHTSPRTHA